VRQKLEPHFQTLEQQGLAAATWWRCGPSPRSPPPRRCSTRQQAHPLPNDLLRDRHRDRHPADRSADRPETKALKQGFNRLDGFSTTAVLYADATTWSNRTTVSAANVRL